MVNFYRLMVEEDDDEGQTFRNVKVWPYIQTFLRETSMAGFPQLVKQPGILKKFFWFVSIAMMSVGLWWECDVFFAKFLAWQATTAVSIQTSRRLYFPAITICNNNPVVYDWYDPEAYEEKNQADQSTASGGAATVPTVSITGGTVVVSESVTSATVTSSATTSPTPTVSARRRKRDVTNSPASGGNGDENLQRVKRTGAIIAPMVSGSGAPSSSVKSGAAAAVIGGGSPGGPIKQFDANPSFSDSMQSLLKIQEKASRLAYENRSIAGHQLCDMILECQYSGVSCSPGSEFKTWHWNSQYGNCYTYNAGFVEIDSPVYGSTDNTWDIKRGGEANDTGIKISKLPGDNYGLYILLNADVDHYVPTTTQIGWRITIHNQTEMPFPEESGIFVAPGTSTRIGITLSYIEQLGVVSNYLYDASYSDCITESNINRDDARNAYSKLMEISYTSSACYKTCYQRRVLQECSCFDFLYPSQGKAFSSSGVTTEPPCSYENTTQWTCRNVMSALYQADALGCSDICPENCQAYAFGTTISSLRWPNPSAETMQALCTRIKSIIDARSGRNDSTCRGPSYIANLVEGGVTYKLPSDLGNCIKGDFSADPNIGNYYEFANYIIGNSFAEVYIYYRDFNYQTVIAGEMLELPDLLAYMGGILGLFFGFSFMTMMEYVQLVIDIIGIIIGKATLLCCKNKVAEEIPLQTLENNDSSSDQSFETNKPMSSTSRIVQGYPVETAGFYQKPSATLNKPSSAPMPGPVVSPSSYYYAQPPYLEAFGPQDHGHHYPYPPPPE